MVGVFNIDIGYEYLKSLCVFLQKLKEVYNIVKANPEKQTAASELRNMIKEFSVELEPHRKVLEESDLLIKSVALQARNIYDRSLMPGGSQMGNAGAAGQPITLNKSVTSTDVRVEVVKKPTYGLDDKGNIDLNREENMASIDVRRYVRLGFNSNKQMSMHYRYQEFKPLEDTEFIMCSTFDSIDISVGKQLKVDQSFWDRLISKDLAHHTVGTYKGSTSVLKERAITTLANLDIPDALGKLDLPTSLSAWSFSRQDKDIMQEVGVRVRLYLIDANITDSQDIGSKDDIYTIIYLGDKKLFDNKDKRINDRDDPKFYSSFEFKAVFPGPSVLKIEFWDYDPIGMDDFVGKCEMDLENRFFDKKWIVNPDHPIEKRDIRKNELSNNSGTVRLWVDMDRSDDKTAMLRPLIDISPLPDMTFEFRVIIWEAYDVPLQDIEGLSDVYVSCNFPSLGRI